MSRATGFVWDSAGRLVGNAMYCGTSDVMWSRVYPSADAAWAAYQESNRAEAAARRPGTLDGIDAALEITHRDCTCGQPPAEGFVGTDYGSLHHWPATFCLPCHAIIGPLNFNEVDDLEGDWPKDGAPEEAKRDGVVPWIEGATADGTTVLIERDPYVNRGESIVIDGEPVALIPGFMAISRLRDGGTTTIRTERGVIHWRRSRRAREAGVLPTLDGETIVPPGT